MPSVDMCRPKTMVLTLCSKYSECESNLKIPSHFSMFHGSKNTSLLSKHDKEDFIHGGEGALSCDSYRDH